MRLIDLHSQNINEDVKSRIQNIWSNLIKKPAVTPTQTGTVVNDITSGFGDFLRKAKDALNGPVNDLRKGAGLSQSKLNMLTGREREIYMLVDAYVKGIYRIQKTFGNGIQVRYPAWNPANSKYVGAFIVDDPEVDQNEIEGIFKDPSYTIPQEASRKKQQLLYGLKRFSQLHKQFVSQGIKDSSRITPKGIQIQFDLGRNAEAFKSAVQKVDGKIQGNAIGEQELSELTNEELTQGVIDGKIDFRKLSDERKKIVLQNIPEIKKDVSVEVQTQALPVAMAIRRNAPTSDIANILQQVGVAGLNLNALKDDMLNGIAQAMNLNVEKLERENIIKVINAALTNRDIQNVSDLDKMSKNEIATLLEKGRLTARQMAKNQVNAMLNFYKMPLNRDESKRPEQLQFVVAMKASPDKANPLEFVRAMQRGLFTANDLNRAGIPDLLIQRMLIAANQQINRANRNSLIQQLKSLETKVFASQDNSKKSKFQEDNSLIDLVQAIAEDKLSFKALATEKLKKLFDPTYKNVSKAIDNLGIKKLAEIMPKVIDEEYLKINDASRQKLKAYLKGKGFQPPLSNSLHSLREQARSVHKKRPMKLEEDQPQDQKRQKEGKQKTNYKYVRRTIYEIIKKLGDFRVNNDTLRDSIEKIAIELINKGMDINSEEFKNKIIEIYRKRQK